MKGLVLFRISLVFLPVLLMQAVGEKMTFPDTSLKTRWLALEIGLIAKKRDQRQWEIIAAVAVDASYQQVIGKILGDDPTNISCRA